MTEHPFQEEPRNFFLLYLSAFTYPLQGLGLVFLIVATFALCLSVAVIFVIPLPAALLLPLPVAYVLAYFMRIIRASVDGKKELPDWPDVTNPYGEIGHYCVLFVGALTFCALPLLVLWVARALSGWVIPPWAKGVAAMAGIFYAPMALLCVVATDRLAGVNPLLGIRSIVRIPIPYLSACALLVLACFLVGLVAECVPNGLLVGSVVGVFLSLYFLAVFGRVIGLIYWANRHKLRWFRP